MTVHYFKQSLAASHKQATADMWADVYRKAFPTMVNTTYVQADGWAQRGGVDRVVTLASGKSLYIDEKVREQDYDDVLLEYFSDVAKRVHGWIAKDLACDFIAYAVLPARVCYLLPFHTLRAAWKRNGRDWVRDYRMVDAKNDGYVTRSVAVPWEALRTALWQEMSVSWETPIKAIAE